MKGAFSTPVCPRKQSCQYSPVDAVCSTFDAMVATLTNIAESSAGPKSTEASGLLLRANSLKFLLALIVFDRLYSQSLNACQMHCKVQRWI